MTDVDEYGSKNAIICHIGRKQFQFLSRDHSNITGKYRGAARKKCNINYKYKSKVPCSHISQPRRL